MGRISYSVKTYFVHFLVYNLFSSYDDRRAALIRLVKIIEHDPTNVTVERPVSVKKLLDQIRSFASSGEPPSNKRYWCEAAEYSQIATAFNLTISENETRQLDAAADYATLQRVARRIIESQRLATHPEVLPQAVFLATNGFEGANTRIADIEVAALAPLVAQLNKSEDRLLFVSARINSGLSSLLWEIHRHPFIQFSLVIHLRPGPSAPEFEHLLIEAMAKAKLDWSISDDATQERRYDAIITALGRAKVLLVVHNIHFWYDIPTSPETRLIKLHDLRKESMNSFEIFVDRFHKSRLGKSSTLIATAAADFVPNIGALGKKGFHEVTLDIRVGLEGQPESVLNGFIESYRRVLYGGQTSTAILDDCPIYEAEPPEGPRMRRFKTHLHRLKESKKSGVPIATLRLRAAGFANPSARSEADPTQGYERLVPIGLMKELPTFSLMAEDIRTVLACLEHIELTAIRLISTGVYWFSKKAAEHVSSTIARMKNDPTLSIELPPRVLGWGDFVTLSNKRPSLVYQYFSNFTHLTGPLAIMAVVQEDWTTFGSQSRRVVHQIIAQRLVDAADAFPTTNARTLLAEEYPFELPRDGAAVVLRSEAIRHFVRAARAYDAAREMMQAAQAQFLKLDEIIPTNPEPSLKSANSSATRNVLSRGGGRYQLKLEILHHLSSDGYGSEPHEHLDAEFKSRYYLEIGIVNLALLRITAAELALGKAKQAHEMGSRAWFDSSLHLVATQILSGKWSEAELILNEIDAATTYSSVDAHLCTSVSVQRVALEMAQNKVPEALDRIQCEVLNDQDNLPTGEEALIVIDALLAASRVNPDALTMAQILVEAGLDELRAKSFPHEIMRFEIRRARCLTALGQPDVADRILDQVSIEFSKHGGAPRALHDFQIAGGECLLKLGWAEWAFSGYLRPCLSRALEAKARANARQAAKLAQLALDQIEENIKAFSENVLMSEDDQSLALVGRMRMESAHAAPIPADYIPAMRDWRLRAGDRSAKLWEKLDPKAKVSQNLPDPFHTNDLSVFKDVRETGAGDLLMPDIRRAFRAEIESALDMQ